MKSSLCRTRLTSVYPPAVALVNRFGLCAMFLLATGGCIAQQADLARIQKDLEMQITKIKEEKKALAAQLDETKTQLATMKDDAQKAMVKVRSDLAPLNQQVKLLREQDLTSLYGKYEVADKRIGDLEKSFQTYSDSTQSVIDTLQTDVHKQGEQLQSTQTQTTTLAQQVDENNRALTNNMTEFQQSLSQFKDTLKDVGVKVGQEGENLNAHQTNLAAQEERLRVLETSFKEQTQALQQLREALEKSGTLLGGRLDEQGGQAAQLQRQVTALQDKVETQQQSVLARLDGLQKDLETLGTHVQADATRVQELNQSVVKLREAQEVMGSLLGKRGDDIIQQAGRLSERMNLVESHQSELTQKLQTNTQKTGAHLQDVNASLQSLSKSLEQTGQTLTNRLTQQEDSLQRLDQTIQQFQQLGQETSSQVDNMKAAVTLTEQLRESVEQISSRLHDLEIHQSGLVGKLDADAQTTNTHLKEVNTSIQSMAQALETASNKLHGRIDDQERRLNQALTKFQSIQENSGVSQANVNHLNQLTDTVNQLREVVNTIGTKLGERVDQHEDRLGQLAQRVNRLQGAKPKN